MTNDGTEQPSDRGHLPPADTASYARNRETLRRIAQRLRTETDIDIDELVPLIDQASAAYKACRERVDAVEQMLRERLPQPSTESSEDED